MLQWHSPVFFRPPVKEVTQLQLRNYRFSLPGKWSLNVGFKVVSILEHKLYVLVITNPNMQSDPLLVSNKYFYKKKSDVHDFVNQKQNSSSFAEIHHRFDKNTRILILQCQFSNPTMPSDHHFSHML